LTILGGSLCPLKGLPTDFEVESNKPGSKGWSRGVDVIDANLLEDGSAIEIAVKVSPESIDVKSEGLNIVVLGKTPVLCKRGCDDFMNRVSPWLLIHVGCKELRNGRENKLSLAIIERLPRLLMLSVLPDCKALKEAYVHLPEPYREHLRVAL